MTAPKSEDDDDFVVTVASAAAAVLVVGSMCMLVSGTITLESSGKRCDLELFADEVLDVAAELLLERVIRLFLRRKLSLDEDRLFSLVLRLLRVHRLLLPLLLILAYKLLAYRVTRKVSRRQHGGVRSVLSIFVDGLCPWSNMHHFCWIEILFCRSNTSS
jgi:hypothetical protein